MDTTKTVTIAEMSASELKEYATEMLSKIDNLQQLNGELNLDFEEDLAESFNFFEDATNEVLFCKEQEITAIRGDVSHQARHIQKIEGIITDAKELQELAESARPNPERTVQEYAQEAQAMCSQLNHAEAIAVFNEIANWIPKEAIKPLKTSEYYVYVRNDGQGMLYIQRKASTYNFVQKMFGNKPIYLPNDQQLTEQFAAGQIPARETSAEAFLNMLQTAIEA